MRRFLSGLIVGSALTGLVYLVLEIEGHDSDSTDSASEWSRYSQAEVLGSRVSTGDSLGPSGGVDSRQLGEARLSITPANTDSTRFDLSADEVRSLTMEELQALYEGGELAAPLLGRVVSEIVRRQNIERWANEPPPTQPIVLPPEFGWLSEDLDPFHEKLQRESADPDWAALTEGQIATFLAENQEITEKYGQPTINCRETGCEVAFVAYGVDESAVRIMAEGMFWSVNDQPWVDQFDNPAGYLFNVRNVGDSTTILWHLKKR